jgi:hypothetical protein
LLFKFFSSLFPLVKLRAFYTRPCGAPSLNPLKNQFIARFRTKFSKKKKKIPKGRAAPGKNGVDSRAAFKV